jgi:hypothetical protein
MGKINSYKLESLKERDHSEDLGVDERIILIWILRISGRRVWIGPIWLSFCEHGNEPSDSTKYDEFID